MKNIESGRTSVPAKQEIMPESPEELAYREDVTRRYLDLSETDMTALQNRIKGVEGHVRVAVHPLYLRNEKYAVLRDRSIEEVHNEFSDALNKVLQSTVKNLNSAPLLLFEEERNIAKTAEHIAAQSGIDEGELHANGLVLVPTEDHSGQLSMSRAREVLRVSQSEHVVNVRNEIRQLSDEVFGQGALHAEQALEYSQRLKELTAVYLFLLFRNSLNSET